MAQQISEVVFGETLGSKGHFKGQCHTLHATEMVGKAMPGKMCVLCVCMCVC